MTIVKVQIPLFTTDPQAPALIYDEARTHMVQQQLDKITAAALLPRGYKAFFEAEWDGQQWKLGNRLGYQDW